MFPGCPEHCNAEGTLCKYSRNIACRLGCECKSVKVRNSTTFLKKMKNVTILVYPPLQIPSNQIMTNTEVASSNINEMSHVMNKENRPPDKEREKPPPPSQNPTNSKI